MFLRRTIWYAATRCLPRGLEVSHSGLLKKPRISSPGERKLRESTSTVLGHVQANLLRCSRIRWGCIGSCVGEIT